MTAASKSRRANIEETERLLEQGFTRRQIAKQLGVHQSTADDYRAALRGVRTKGLRAQAHRNETPPADEQKSD